MAGIVLLFLIVDMLLNCYFIERIGHIDDMLQVMSDAIGTNAEVIEDISRSMEGI